MASVARKRKHVVVELTADEAALLRSLPEQLAPALGRGPRAGVSDDPVHDRLFPRAYLDPTEDEAEHAWQDMVHADLVAEKTAALALLVTTLDDASGTRGGDVKVSLDDEQVHAWLSALNDARLALGVTLGITDDHDPGALDPRDPASHPYLVYDWLTMLQGALLDAIMD